MNEAELRKAFTWALRTTASDGIIKHWNPLHFAASGSVRISDHTINCPHLWHEQPGRRVTVSISPKGRKLHYVETYADHSMRLEITLPREFWAPKP